MRYIWIISYIYQTPSAILFPQKVLRPSLPRTSPHVTSRVPPPLVRVRAVSREAVSGGTTLILITITTYQPST